MPSFDIVSSFDMQELDNAVNMVKRDINNRYDFKGTTSSITLNKNDNNIIINGDSDYHMNTIVDMLENRSISRKVSIRTFTYNKIENTSGMKLKQLVDLKSGISKEKGKVINTIIKNERLKINSQIQGDKIRVTGKKIDDLQEVIQILKEKVLDIPLQFTNLKK